LVHHIICMSILDLILPVGLALSQVVCLILNVKYLEGGVKLVLSRLSSRADLLVFWGCLSPELAQAVHGGERERHGVHVVPSFVDWNCVFLL
jgi:hypothetical protein